jgi:hypothetical protein
MAVELGAAFLEPADAQHLMEEPGAVLAGDGGGR